SFLEYTPQKRIRSLEETIETGNRELTEMLDKEIPQDAEVIDKILTYSELGEKGVEVTVEYLCREDIAKQRIIDKIENLEYDKIDKE
ncbi:MAG: sporulation protein YqfD, partial [Clostridia bacterium]|nr:sporulation protein YqfD [Clostridia bacterium]